ITQTATSSLLSTRSRSRIPRILVRREEINTRIVVKNSLRAVAVMHVPIDDRDLIDLGILLLRVTRGDGDVIEKTKAHRALFGRVITRRTHRHKPVLHVPGHDQIDRLTRRAGCAFGGIERAHRDDRVAVEITDAFADTFLDEPVKLW